MFLTPEQLLELTDLQLPGAQKRWLAERGFKFEVGASGRPKVLISEVERRMLGAPHRQTRELNVRAIT